MSLTSLYYKQIILFDNQRQITPLINNINKKRFIFLNTNYLWFLLKPISNIKIKKKIFLIFLKLLNPRFIISYDWLTEYQKLYSFWAKKYNKDFIVVQHGVYSGGINTVKQSRFARCTIMYCWSQYFSNLFKSYNKNKKVNIITFGNPIYNIFNRDNFKYKETEIKHILVLPTLIQDNNLKNEYEDLISKIILNDFKIAIKQHPMQIQYGSFQPSFLINSDIYKILENQEYDLIISDNSTSLLDAIFFKNKVLFYDPTCSESIYSDFLYNIYNSFPGKDLNSYINIPLQEKLLKKLGGGYSTSNSLKY